MHCATTDITARHSFLLAKHEFIFICKENFVKKQKFYAWSFDTSIMVFIYLTRSTRLSARRANEARFSAADMLLHFCCLYNKNLKNKKFDFEYFL